MVSVCGSWVIASSSCGDRSDFHIRAGGSRSTGQLSRRYEITACVPSFWTMDLSIGSRGLPSMPRVCNWYRVPSWGGIVERLLSKRYNSLRRVSRPSSGGKVFRLFPERSRSSRCRSFEISWGTWVRALWLR